MQAASAAAPLTKATKVAELKSQLAQLGLDTSGKKQELYERLRAANGGGKQAKPCAVGAEDAFALLFLVNSVAIAAVFYLGPLLVQTDGPDTGRSSPDQFNGPPTAPPRPFAPPTAPGPDRDRSSRAAPATALARPALRCLARRVRRACARPPSAWPQP